MRTLGQTTGVAIAGAIWAIRVTAAAGQQYEPITAAPPFALVAGMHDAMLVAAFLAALAILPTLVRGQHSGEQQRDVVRPVKVEG